MKPILAKDDLPVLDARALAAALEAFRTAKPLGPGHPLTTFASLRGPCAARCNLDRDMWIFDRLIGAIRRQLDRHRRFYGLTCSLPYPNRPVALQALRNDFHCCSAGLEAWSLLYHRYICMELDLSVEEIAVVVGQAPRTLQRRQQAGLLRLAHILLHRERKACCGQQQQVLRSQLPAPRPPFLAGRDREIGLSIQHMSSLASPRHLILHGAPGCGKSSMALAVAHRLIDAAAIRVVVWIQRPQPSLSQLVQSIGHQLGVAGSANDLDLSLRLQTVETLIVIDDAQAVLADLDLLTGLRRKLSAARLILCAHQLPGDVLDMACVSVPGLDRTAAFAAFEYQVNRLSLSHRHAIEARFERFFVELGGNPQALRLAVMAGRQYDALKIAAVLYEPVWQSLSPRSRWLWRALAEAEIDSRSESGSAVGGMDIPALLDELERASVLESIRDEPLAFALSPLAKRFVEYVIGQERRSPSYGLPGGAPQMMCGATQREGSRPE